jgi:hypothetical protein
MESDVRSTFETSDLNLASFLRCRDFTIKDMRRGSGKTIFVFADSAELHHAMLEFANDGPVPVRSFCNTLRDLKAIVR